MGSAGVQSSSLWLGWRRQNDEGRDAEGKFRGKDGSTRPVPAKTFQLPLQFDLPPGNIFIFVRVGVRDVPSGSVGTLEIPMSVDKP